MVACVHLVRRGIQCPCDQRVDSKRQWYRTGASGIRTAWLRSTPRDTLEVALDNEL
jgi:hypothetical protein